jgi:hypothetical protein
MAQQRESGSSGSQLLQHGRANALRLTLRPNPNAKQASNTLVRDFLFIAFSCADGATGALLPLPFRSAGGGCRPARFATTPSVANRVREAAFAVAGSYLAVLARLAPRRSERAPTAAGLRRCSLRVLNKRRMPMRIGRAGRRCRNSIADRPAACTFGAGARKEGRSDSRRCRPPGPRAGFAKRDADETACPSGCGHPCAPGGSGPIPGCRSNPSGVGPAETRCESHNRIRERARPVRPGAGVGRRLQAWMDAPPARWAHGSIAAAAPGGKLRYGDAGACFEAAVGANTRRGRRGRRDRRDR